MSITPRRASSTPITLSTGQRLAPPRLMPGLEPSSWFRVSSSLLRFTRARSHDALTPARLTVAKNAKAKIQTASCDTIAALLLAEVECETVATPPRVAGRVRTLVPSRTLESDPPACQLPHCRLPLCRLPQRCLSPPSIYPIRWLHKHRFGGRCCPQRVLKLTSQPKKSRICYFANSRRSHLGQRPRDNVVEFGCAVQRTFFATSSTIGAAARFSYTIMPSRRSTLRMSSCSFST